MPHLQKIAFQPVQSYVETKCGKQAMSKTGLTILVERVLQSIHASTGHSYPKIKARLLSGKHTHVHEAVDRLIKSGSTPWKRQLTPKNPVESLIFAHIQGDSPTLKDLFSNKTLLKSIFLSPDPKLMKEIRNAVQSIYQDLWRSIQETPPQTKMEHFHYETMVGDLASFLAYQNAVQNEMIQIPVRINQTWQLAYYQIDKIPLTPPCLGSPIVAFGFKPITTDAPPLLLFKGTTRPADDGSGLSLITDINPGASTGAYAFHLGKNRLRKWLKANTTHHKAITFGTSLGGAHAWRSALYFPDMVQEARAFCPPGFSFSDLRKLKAIQKQDIKPKIRLFCQYNDPVHYIDLPASKGVKYYEIIGEKIKSGVAAHSSLYSLHNRSTILRMESHTIKSPWTRAAFTITRIAMTIFCFIPFVLIHFIQTGIRQIVEKIQNKIASRRVIYLKSSE